MGSGIVGAALRAAREAAGVSLSVLAVRTNYSKSLLALLETGKRTIHADHVRAYSRALGVSIGALDVPPNDPLRAAHEWLVRDQPASAEGRAGRRVGAGLAAAMERRVAQLRRLDDEVGSGALYPLVAGELSRAKSLVREATYGPEVGRRLFTVVAELCQLAGWVASDAGRYGEAQRTYLEGVSAADRAGARTLAAQLLSSLSYQIANVGDPADALLLAQTAVAGAEGATPAVRALLLERVAWAAARARDTAATRRALDAVDDAFDHRGTEPDPDWVYWLNRDEIDVMAGRCHVELGDPVRAEPLLARVIERYPAHHERERALYRTWLAEALARAGRLADAREVLALIPGQIDSDRVRRRLAVLAGLMTG
ncbi:helix-turn-helix domain-containing protein [Nocardia farcinica]|uniref:helix-turn-helix domain-containing protein n=1 Tax=Nocardia farcinica TaxID=37329 RepID=UPI0024563E0B|nr:helix-turn-helix domain-containing protein [Nocardia farcinica]